MSSNCIFFLGSVPRKTSRGPFWKTKPEVPWFHGFMTYLSVHSMKPRNLSTCFCGFISYIHLPYLILLSSNEVDEKMKSRNYGFVGSWFRPHRHWVTEMTIGFMVSWFRPPPSLGPQNDCRFRGFMVSPTLSLDHRNDYRFHGFVVSWFRGFAHSHLLVIKMIIGFTVSWFRCFIRSHLLK